MAEDNPTVVAPSITAEDELTRLQPMDMDAGVLFSGQASGRMIKGYDRVCTHTPALDANYVFHESMREIVVWLMSPSDPLYVFGPTGSGKTSLIRQLAAKLRYPVFDVTGHGRLEFADLVGHITVDNGSMRFEYGPLALAMKHGGLFLLNEIDLLDPATLTGLNGVLDGDPLCIPEHGGEVIKPHPMFRLVATANTNGGSDSSGLYQGVLQQNLAFMDRFWLCEVGYPEPATELALLEKVASELPAEVRSRMVDYANEVREQFIGNGDDLSFADRIEVTFSTRTLLRWADLTLRFQPLSLQGISPVTYALDRALSFRASPETRAMLNELAQRIFSTSSEPD